MEGLNQVCWNQAFHYTKDMLTLSYCAIIWILEQDMVQKKYLLFGRTCLLCSSWGRYDKMTRNEVLQPAAFVHIENANQSTDALPVKAQLLQAEYADWTDTASSQTATLWWVEGSRVALERAPNFPKGIFNWSWHTPLNC